MSPRGLYLLLLGVLCVGCAPPLSTFAVSVLAAEPQSFSVAATLWKVAVGASDKDLAQVYNSVKAAPGYPSRFKSVEKGTTRNKVSNKELLEKLRKVERGTWVKVYKDGWVGEKKVSLHYFESPSGKVFDFKVKPGWSNL
ncbi:hypothetical protein G4177_09530 [Corallococcus sp. ZKHCc1 1396]|uniref:Lipoprotein n=1 Tax=Corallococcus soli TaxID=2710757 RepID=A0ABR9PKI0_9BACT|nr:MULTISPECIES: hypothetical protein [Corallococcus]MBE4748406.1 hypothetical protein [Corallococcus soli]MCY1034809.1 hypothetical protein [Corallococcus sp. BB11-1]